MTKQINAERLQRDFHALAAFGATAEGGVDRPAFSGAHLEARNWLRQRIINDRLEARVDGAGNHSAILRSGSPAARTLLIGSHLDSVPQGGRYDGALGVLAGLEVLRTIRESQRPLKIDLEVIDFSDEEGTLLPLLGSRALTGQLTAEMLQRPPAGRQALEQGLVRAGLTDATILQARRDPGTLAGYLELHIEQASRLARQRVPIGLVRSIVGMVSYRVSFWGEARHAGATPMDERRDAALGAAAFILAVRECVVREFPGAVATVGQVAVKPGATNVIPGLAELALEFRAGDDTTLSDLERVLLERAESEGARFDLKVEAERRAHIPPSLMDPQVMAVIGAAADDLGLAYLELDSGAFHDAQPLASVCPTGMIFVPSVGGISHSPRELTSWEDCLHGATVLLHTVLRLADRTASASPA